jgi:hypothetical protein
VTRGRTHSRYSETTLSAATTFSAKTFGVMNCAFFDLRSVSVTPRATEHLPQTKMGTRWATTPSTISLSDGMATGMTALITLSFIR